MSISDLCKAEDDCDFKKIDDIVPKLNYQFIGNEIVEGIRETLIIEGLYTLNVYLLFNHESKKIKRTKNKAEIEKMLMQGYYPSRIILLQSDQCNKFKTSTLVKISDHLWKLNCGKIMDVSKIKFLNYNRMIKNTNYLNLLDILKKAKNELPILLYSPLKELCVDRLINEYKENEYVVSGVMYRFTKDFEVNSRVVEFLIDISTDISDLMSISEIIGAYNEKIFEKVKGSGYEPEYAEKYLAYRKIIPIIENNNLKELLTISDDIIKTNLPFIEKVCDRVNNSVTDFIKEKYLFAKKENNSKKGNKIEILF